MRRFRPNIVIDGELPWEEDGWRRMRIGALEFDFWGHCSRCKIINLHPQTGAASPDKEPLKTLACIHRQEEGACFGIHLALHAVEADGVAAGAAGAFLRVGDPIEVLQ